ncbi:MAG TPA: DinB family protein [Chitinophagaceae bacterium]|jgi:vancomycin resistance protein YoaR|nr:DinB family protein [Chitinophagaceae bacterium]
MLKRTKGRLLLTLLVITGLAGTLSNPALNKEERKFALTQLKDTKANFIKSVKGLSETQLNFKTAPDRWSIKECIFHIAMTETALTKMFETTMQTQANPEKRADIKMTDEEIIKKFTDRTHKLTAPEMLNPLKSKPSWETAAEALSAFKDIRQDKLKYVKTTTEDLRNHVFQMPFGSIDGYQMILFMAAHSDRHTQQINEIKADPNFPKQ